MRRSTWIALFAGAAIGSTSLIVVEKMSQKTGSQAVRSAFVAAADTAEKAVSKTTDKIAIAVGPAPKLKNAAPAASSSAASKKAKAKPQGSAYPSVDDSLIVDPWKNKP